LIEDEDFTESSEALEDYFNENKEDIKKKTKIILTRLKPKKLRPIDEVLLKGVYTNDKKELNDEKLFDNSNDLNVFKRLISTFAVQESKKVDG
jgi:hypothetical protein